MNDYYLARAALACIPVELDKRACLMTFYNLSFIGTCVATKSDLNEIQTFQNTTHRKMSNNAHRRAAIHSFLTVSTNHTCQLDEDK